MTGEKETTVLDTSVGADEGQPNQNLCEDSLADSLEEYNRYFRQLNDPSYLATVSMRELYETAYESKPPLIDGLLFPGTYLLVGAPKLGKSFLVAQLAYHVSTGTPLWKPAVSNVRYGNRGSTLFCYTSATTRERIGRAAGAFCPGAPGYQAHYHRHLAKGS